MKYTIQLLNPNPYGKDTELNILSRNVWEEGRNEGQKENSVSRINFEGLSWRVT